MPLMIMDYVFDFSLTQLSMAYLKEDGLFDLAPQVIKICGKWLPLQKKSSQAAVASVGFKLITLVLCSQTVFEIGTKLAFFW